MKQNIIFFHPSRGYGGGELIIKRIVENHNLLLNYFSNIYIIDYIDGTSRLIQINSKIRFLDFTENQKIILPEDSILVVFSSYLYSIERYLVFNKSVSFFLWVVHPYELLLSLFPFFKYFLHYTNAYFYIKLILSLLFRKEYSLIKKKFIQISNSLVFMDITNKESFYGLFPKTISRDVYLPIPVDSESDLREKIKRNKKKSMTCLWIGRIVNFKVFSLINVLEAIIKVIEHDDEISINFNIIGNGKWLSKLKPFLNYRSRKLVLNFLGTQNPENVINYITRSDLVFAMGTSALESAKCKIPTILLDFSYRKIPKVIKYRWIYESVGYSLGENISSHTQKNRSHYMKEIINTTLEDEENRIGEKCFQYFIENHSIISFLPKWKNVLENALSPANNLIGIHEELFSKSKKIKILFSCYYFLNRIKNKYLLKMR